MRGADELRNVGSQVVGDIDGVETYGSTCLVRAARSDELLTLGGGEEADLHQPELKASGTGVPGDLSQELPKRAGSEDPAQGRRVLSGRFQAVGKVYR